jgi:hypothetical protein
MFPKRVGMKKLRVYGGGKYKEKRRKKDNAETHGTQRERKEGVEREDEGTEKVGEGYPPRGTCN